MGPPTQRQAPWAPSADPRLNHAFAVTAGVRADEAAELLRAFFRSRRS